MAESAESHIQTMAILSDSIGSICEKYGVAKPEFGSCYASVGNALQIRLAVDRVIEKLDKGNRAREAVHEAMKIAATALRFAIEFTPGTAEEDNQV